MRHLLLTMSFLVLLSFAHAQTFDKAKMDSLFELIELHERGMGSIAIMKEGREVYQKSFGYADVEAGKKSEKATKYRIGSITKTFTATMVMQLIQEGKLELSTNLSQYFPEIANAEKITIKHLLQHSSGLFNITNDPNFLQWNTQPHSQEELLKKIVDNGAVFEPGERNEYSNTNYVLLTFIIEKIENNTYPEVLERRIIKPLKLENTRYGGKPDAAKNEAYSYSRTGTWKKQPDTDISIPLGAGAIISTPSDLNTFYHSLFNGKLVTEASLNTMKTLENGFGLGLFLIPFHERTSFGHSGGIDGFQSMASFFPDDQVAIAFCANGLAIGMNEIMIGALSIFFDKAYSLPEFSPIVTLSPEELDTYLGTYSSPTFPLKITITKNESSLIGQATGQPTFPLEALGEHKFEFRQAGLVLEFTPEQETMLLKQGGGVFELKKE